MKVAVIGAGAIGGPIAAMMSENNVDVTLITKYQDLAEKISSQGIEIRGIGQSRVIPVSAVANIEDLNEKVDICFLATKGNDVKSASKSILPKLKEDSVVVTLQNGIVENDVAEIVGAHRVIGAVVGWGSTMIKPGIIEKTSKGEFIIGKISDNRNQNIEEVKILLKMTDQTIITNNIFGALFTKLIINSCITGLGAVTGEPFGELLANRRTRLLFMGIAKEAIDVANAMKLHLEKVGGMNPYLAAYSPSKLKRVFKHLLIRIVGFKIRHGKSSSLQSLERGKKTEIDFLNGYIVKNGETLGIQTPINRKVIEIINEIEMGQREINPQNALEIPTP